jgi:hypothetical protein
MALDGFNTLEIQHKEIFHQYFLQDPPQTSELTFTNLFMWRYHYHPIWSEIDDCLLIILIPDGVLPFGLQPIGPGNKKEALEILCQKLGDLTHDAKICRVGEEFVEKYVDRNQYDLIFDRDNSDYVYRAEDLIKLSGRKYHKKKNHLNRFLKNYQYEYRDLDMDLVECFLEMQEKWCQLKECLDKPDLFSEDYAVHEALTHFEELDYQGIAILIESNVEAFSLGEALNSDTAVVHIEKANPAIPGLYNAINQLFCSKAWAHMEYINREQDLGLEGLRKAKESYYPHHMANKYTLIPKED